MPAPRPTPLVCPVCRTRLRVQAALVGTEVSCPECASRLLIAADQQSARLLAVHPLETVPVPVETEPTETSSAAPFLSRRQLWLAAGVTLIVSGGLFISLIRSESDRGSASSDTEVAPANAESPEPEVPVAVADTTPMPEPDPVAPAPVVVPPAVIEPPVAVAVVAPVPPDPEVKPVAPQIGRASCRERV